MAAASTEKKISLKILIHKKSGKVVFAEAGKDFVDFIFSIMSLPLSTVTKLLKDKTGMVGCLGSLFKSIESLEDQYYVSNGSKVSVLKPRAAVTVPLLSFIDAPNTINLYKCKCANSFSDCNGVHCSKCSCPITYEFGKYVYVPPKKIGERKPDGYVKEAVPYMVMDNLEVKPMSLSRIKYHVKDFANIEEKQVELGVQEGLALLKASLESQAVLTTVFNPIKKK